MNLKIPGGVNSSAGYFGSTGNLTVNSNLSANIDRNKVFD